MTQSNRRIDAMEKKAARRQTARVLTGIERELLDSFTKIVERQFRAMATRVDETNRRLGRLFARLDRLKAKKLVVGYEPDDGPLTDEQYRAIRKRAKRDISAIRERAPANAGEDSRSACSKTSQRDGRRR